MAEDSEKRFHSIMDKLFHSPKSNLPLSSSSSSGQKMRGQKRPFSATESNLKGDKGEGQYAAQASPCRPWNREDLMRKLATFKSMRWFAKPKAVDAVNCARRGWVNVDFDIIACEICGARLQFSTPSAWNQQQVEKAALVFSLKLESGHKLLCPWIDNACDAKLALFPPMPAPVLVDHYKERSSALLQLSALPVTPASLVESMRSSQLKHFLKQSIAMECGSAPNDSCWTEYLGNDAEVVSADLYYQALRLLSLCGWEPRLLPYMVDCEDQPKLSGSNDNTSNLSYAAADEQSNRLSVSMSGSNESIRKDDDPGASSFYYDPNSTVLDCKLCGASIGLWAFATVPRPLELVKVVGQADIGGGSNLDSKTSAIENHADNGKSDLSAANGEAASPRKTVLNLTIAGGPPPTRQNFRATISLPVIGRNVRTRLSYMSSDVSTGEEEPIAFNAIMDGSTKDKQNEETNSGVSGSEPQDNAPSTADIAKSQEMIVDSMALRKETLSLTSGEQNENGVRDIAMTTSQKDMATLSVDEDISRQSPNKKMEFHPISQHRHFCPWVASTGTVSPGWQQTLSALQKEKVFTVPELEGSPSSPSPSPSLIMVDDPIMSIRKLFESPPAKRPKHASK